MEGWKTQYDQHFKQRQGLLLPVSERCYAYAAAQFRTGAKCGRLDVWLACELGAALLRLDMRLHRLTWQPSS